MLPDYITVNRYFRKLIADVDPLIPVIIRGVQYPTADDFIEVNSLAIDPKVARPSQTYCDIQLEVRCFSKHTNVREDNSGVIDPHFNFADNYIEMLSQKRYMIDTACIQLKAPRIVNLDLSSLGDFSQAIDQQSPRLNMFCMVINVAGQIHEA
jgi:hypothetical protein